MEVRGNKPAEGSEARRFSAGRPAPKPGAKSFGAVLKKAVSDPGPAQTAPAGTPREEAIKAQDSTEKASEGGSTPAAAAAVPASPEGPASAETSFADHMDMVRFRLKTGYYASKAIDDALTDKLSGYFDDLT
jgi:hypothetical protein